MQLSEGLVGKALALGLGLGLVAIAYFVAVVPVVGVYQDMQHSLQERLDTVQRLDGSSRDLPRLRSLDDQWQGTGATMLLSDTSDTNAAASIQSTVKNLIETSGGALTNSEILDPDQPDDRYRRIRVRVSFVGDLPLLTSVLRGIDVAKPALFVDNLDVRASGAADDDSEDGGQKLAIAFDVYGFRSL
jgi:general secretion pathway protein M